MRSPTGIGEVTFTRVSPACCEKDSTELTQQELSKVSGGFRNCCSGKHFNVVSIGLRRTDGSKPI
jgi:hypothetical protein